MQPYAVYAHERVFEFLLNAGRQKQLVLAFLRRLSNDPYVEGDFKDIDEIGRPLEVKLVGPYAITYWADHAGKEIKVINVEPAGT